MKIPRIKGKRREVRRMLAQRSKEVLGRYRRGEAVGEECPLRKAVDGGACLPAIGRCSKDQAVQQMVDSLLATGAVPRISADEIMDCLRKREELAPFAIGHGIAVPHIQHPKVNRLMGRLAHSVEGIDFDALDGKPVHLLMLYLIPAARPDDGLRPLALLERMAG